MSTNSFASRLAPRRIPRGRGGLRGLLAALPAFFLAAFLGASDAARAQSTQLESCASCPAVDAGRGPGRRGPPDGDEGLGRVAFFQGRQAGNNGRDHEIGDDAGLGAHTGREEDRGLFKIPTLRNVALTAPYMHDGRFRTLKEVVEHYRRGVKAHPNLDGRLGGGDRGRRRGLRGIQLTVAQRNALIAFLETLTDEALVADPRFSDPWR